MDMIYLHELRVDALIGVWEWERRIRQTLIMDVEIGTDTARAGTSDALEDTVDYKAVSDRIVDFTRASEFHLIEALGEGITRVLMQEFGIPWVRLRINKRGILREARDVGIVIERGTRT